MAGKQPAGGPRIDAPESLKVRNVVLIGPSQSGKTTLVEALLTRAGAIPRAGSVAEGTTVCDHERIEQAHGRSVSLAVAPLVHGDTRVNLVDTPGYVDFVGEARAGLRAADCALVVVAANEELDESIRSLWHECVDVQMPRAVVVTKLDHARADLAGTIRSAREAFGERVLPVYLEEGGGLTGLISGEVNVPERAALVEAVIEESEDEDLMERYVGGQPVDERSLIPDLEKAIAGAALFPVVPVCATTGEGLDELLDLVVKVFPSPREHPSPEVFTPNGARDQPVTGDPDGPLVAEIVQTSSDSYVGRTSLVRVFSGSLTPDLPVHVSGHFSSLTSAAGHAEHDEEERIGPLSHPFGARQVPAQQLVAGDLGVVSRLSRAETGDTLSGVEHPVVLRPWRLPEPMLPMPVEAATRSDEDKLSEALTRLAAEDPGLRVEHNAETRQQVLWVMGEAHGEVALDRLQNRYGVHVRTVDLVVPLRECFTAGARGHGRLVKQSGGHGQFAICDLEVEPLPEGSGFEFVDMVVGGAVPRQFIPSVEKGVRAQLERGLRAGYPLVDLRVTLCDGKAHSVDSSDSAFQQAGALALRDAAEQGRVAFLEPFDEIEVVVPDDLVGAVMSDLSARRGRLLGTDTAGDDHALVRAQVPQRELVRYAIELRTQTRGAGTFTRSFAHYEPMPDEQARQVSARD